MSDYDVMLGGLADKFYLFFVYSENNSEKILAAGNREEERLLSAGLL